MRIPSAGTQAENGDDEGNAYDHDNACDTCTCEIYGVLSPPEPAPCIAQLFFAEVRRLNHPAHVSNPAISEISSPLAPFSL
jgi:hypothetical protein